MTPIGIVATTERWTEARLADGTVLRVRPVVASVTRTGRFTAEGEPVYVVNSHLVVEVDAEGDDGPAETV